MSVTLDQIIPWGRSLGEYRLMFSLSYDDLTTDILGCGDGPASFNVEMKALGRRVTSFDPIYAFSRAEIERRVEETYRGMMEQVARSQQDYVWDRFKNPQGLVDHRLATMQRFLEDYDAGLADGRYVLESLPKLSFSDGQFDLAVCSHLLFLYSEQLSQEFHVESILELCRVANEVRIFPLLDLKCRKSVHIEPAQARLMELGYKVEITPVNYEFQKGGNEMLRICR
jgi:hypothetical protein